MTRSRLFYPLNRSVDADAGGLSDLQTDVMRFIAILALCLVAIFALVQSIPLAPVEQQPTTLEEQEVPVAAPQELTPEPDVAVERDTQTTKAPPPEKPEREGFTLRFEDETALTRLVARNEVGLYAILPAKSYRMNVNRGTMSFWPASMPNRFHEMDERTVPDSVIDAFGRSSASRAEAPKWGVTIPPATSRQIEEYLREAEGGALIIDAGGELRLEP